MFNPKQALQRIRKAKQDKQQAKSVMNEVLSEAETKPLFSSDNSELLTRVAKLQQVVTKLNQQLSISNQNIGKLKRQNSHLQTQLLKLQYQNTQLRNSAMVSDIRQNLSQKVLNTSHHQQNNISLISKSHNTERQHSHGIMVNYQSDIKGNIIEEQLEHYSPEVQEIIEQVSKEPIERILKKKQHNFRALKANSRQIHNGNKYLQKLSNLQKQYSKTMKKPIICIKLDEADFQI